MSATQLANCSIVDVKVIATGLLVIEIVVPLPNDSLSGEFSTMNCHFSSSDAGDREYSR